VTSIEKDNIKSFQKLVDFYTKNPDARLKKTLSAFAKFIARRSPNYVVLELKNILNEKDIKEIMEGDLK
jgi:hypothetical protein